MYCCTVMYCCLQGFVHVLYDCSDKAICPIISFIFFNFFVLHGHKFIWFLCRLWCCHCQKWPPNMWFRGCIGKCSCCAKQSILWSKASVIRFFLFVSLITILIIFVHHAKCLHSMYFITVQHVNDVMKEFFEHSLSVMRIVPYCGIIYVEPLCFSIVI